MPRTIKTTGQYATDREIDALWRAIDAVRGGEGSERIIQPIIQQIVNNSPEFVTLIENTIEQHILNLTGVSSIRTRFAPGAKGDIRLLEGQAMTITQRGTDFTFHVETCSEPGEDISPPLTQTVAFFDTFTEYDTTDLPSHVPDVGAGWRTGLETGYQTHNAHLDGYARSFVASSPWRNWTRDNLTDPNEINIECHMGWTTSSVLGTPHLLWGSYPGSDPMLIPDLRMRIGLHYNADAGTVYLDGTVNDAPVDNTVGVLYTPPGLVTVRIRLRPYQTTVFLNGVVIGDVYLDDAQPMSGCAGIETFGGDLTLRVAYDNFTVGGPYDPMAGVSPIPAKCDHTHLGVRSIKQGTTELYGNVNFAGDGLDVSLSTGTNTVTTRLPWWRWMLIG